jgi:hypothetical protein
MTVNDPSATAGFLTVCMDKIMALATERREIFVATKPLTNPASLMVEISCFLSLATLALWVEGHVRLLFLCILVVFTLTFWGCSPQPSF